MRALIPTYGKAVENYFALLLRERFQLLAENMFGFSILGCVFLNL
jgi:hypothetical protein